jgi:hypothetical protein
VTAFPASSTAMQKEVVGHDTDLTAWPVSMPTGVLQSGEFKVKALPASSTAAQKEPPAGQEIESSA